MIDIITYYHYDGTFSQLFPIVLVYSLKWYFSRNVIHSAIKFLSVYLLRLCFVNSAKTSIAERDDFFGSWSDSTFSARPKLGQSSQCPSKTDALFLHRYYEKNFKNRLNFIN